MKQIGAEIGVNESRVSQLHARAVQRLRKALGADCSAPAAAAPMKPAMLAFQQSMRRMKMAEEESSVERTRTAPRARRGTRRRGEVQGASEASGQAPRAAAAARTNRGSAVE